MEIKDFEDYNLHVIFDNSDYREINDFKYNFAATHHNNGVCGFIDIKGYETLLYDYDEVGDFSSIIAPVCKNNMWGFINKNFNQIIECKYIYLRNYNDLFIVKENLNSNFLVINGMGEIIYKNKNINTVLDYLSKKESSNQVLSNIVKKEYTIPYSNKKYCMYFNNNNEKIIPIANTENRNFSCGFVIVKTDINDFRIFNEKGRQIKPHTCIKLNAETMYLNNKIEKFNFSAVNKEYCGYSSLIRCGEYEYILSAPSLENLDDDKNDLFRYLQEQVNIKKVKK